MGSIARRGPALRSAVRQRRRARWMAVLGSSVGVVSCAVLVARTPDALFITTLCAVSIALLLHLVTFVPVLERRALRADITRPPLTRARARRCANVGLIAATVAVAVALMIGALTDAWLTAVAVAAPIALAFALLAFLALRAGRHDGIER